MKEKTAFLIVEGFQLALGALLLILSATLLAGQAITGKLNMLGIVLFGAMFILAIRLTSISWREYRQVNNNPENGNEN